MLSRIMKVVLLVVLAVVIVGCSATPTRRSFKEGWKDSVVSTKVKFKLMKDDLVKKRNIDVDTWRGVVTLTGRVTSMEEKERSEQLAWQAKGVRGVDNYLKLVDSTYLTTGEAVAEGEVEEIEVTEVAKIKTTPSGTKVVEKEKILVKKPAAHPMKTQNSTVSSRVEGPVVFEDKTTTTEKTKLTARRNRYNRPQVSQVKEGDLTSEERLAQEAAEELRKLRGEDLTE